MTRCAAAARRTPRPGQQGSEPQPVEGVAGAEQERGGSAGERVASRGDHADQGELGRAREHEQGQHAGLGHVESRGHGQRPERGAVGAGREPDAQAVADDRPLFRCSSHASAVCRRTCLTSVVARAVQVELAVCGVGGPPGPGEERTQGVVGGQDPGDRPGEAVCLHRLGGGLEQPGAVALPALGRVQGHLLQLSVGDRVAVRVARRAGDREPDDPVALQGDQDPVAGVAWLGHRAAPGRGRGVDGLGAARDRLGRQQVGVRRLPGAQLELGDRRGVVGPGDAHADIGRGAVLTTGHGAHPAWLLSRTWSSGTSVG